MKNINLFRYKDTSEFWAFLSSYDYKLDDVIGFSLVERKQHDNNTLTEYCIHFKDGEHEYFRAVCFKDFNEYRQAKLGFSYNKLIDWFESADIRGYKTRDCWIYGVKGIKWAA